MGSRATSGPITLFTSPRRCQVISFKQSLLYLYKSSLDAALHCKSASQSTDSVHQCQNYDNCDDCPLQLFASHVLPHARRVSLELQRVNIELVCLVDQNFHSIATVQHFVDVLEHGLLDRVNFRHSRIQYVVISLVD